MNDVCCWFDSHCHLNDVKPFSNYFQEAQSQGIHRYMLPGTHPAQWQHIQSFRSSYCAISFGIHPWFIDSLDEQLRELQSMLVRQGVCAVGEIGLDFDKAAISKSVNANQTGDKQQQLKAARTQLGYAADLQLPAILHVVKAHQEMISMLKQHPLRGVVIHGFMGSIELAKQYISLGCYLGIGPQILRSNKLKHTLKDCPLERLLLETDAPYRPFGSNSNPLLSLLLVAKCVASLKDVSLQQLKQVMYQNTLEVFNLSR